MRAMIVAGYEFRRTPWYGGEGREGEREDEEEGEGWKPRLKRSTSNPFLYFNERREDIMGINDPLPTNKPQKMRLEQTAVFNNIHIGHEEDLDDIDI